MISPFTVLERKRAGETLDAQEIAALVSGAADGSWATLSSARSSWPWPFRLSAEETSALTRAMLASGEQWDLAAAFPGVVDKHSTGGVGDKVSLILAPLLAACDVPVAMLTGRSLGHTGGTADKLESIPGLDLALDRARTLDLLGRTGMAIGIATAAVAPADRRLYALRHRTATIGSLPLIVASILSKKMAAGRRASCSTSRRAAARSCRNEAMPPISPTLVETSLALGRSGQGRDDGHEPAARPVGAHGGSRREPGGARRPRPRDLMAVTLVLAEEASRLVGRGVERAALEKAISSAPPRALRSLGRGAGRVAGMAEGAGSDPGS